MWIAFALAAATLQTLRNGVARALGERVAPALNSWARFAFNLPWCVGLVLLGLPGRGWPELELDFLGTCALAGLAQLLANVALVAAFRRTTFAQSIVLHKLEVVLTALAGALWFAEAPDALGWCGVAACAVGTFLLSAGPGAPGSSVGRGFRPDRGALLALGCAALLVVASFAVKRALGLLAAANPALADQPLWLSLHTLLHVTWIEVVLLSVALWLRTPAVFRAVPGQLGPMAALGALAFCSSLCWYAAFAQGIVAYVRALGQLEAVLSVLLGVFWFHERQTLQKLPAAALIVLGMSAVTL